MLRLSYPAVKSKYYLIKKEKESLLLCGSPNNYQMEHLQIVQILLHIANVLPGTRISSQIMYQEQKVKLARNINHKEALNQLLM